MGLGGFSRGVGWRLVVGKLGWRWRNGGDESGKFEGESRGGICDFSPMVCTQILSPLFWGIAITAKGRDGLAISSLEIGVCILFMREGIR